MAPETDAWTRLVEQCVLRRKSTEELGDLAKVLSSTTPIDSPQLARVLLRTRPLPSPFVHPLIPKYAERLLRSNYLQVHDVLLTLLEYSPFGATSVNSDDAAERVATKISHADTPDCSDFLRDIQTEILSRIARLLASGQAARGLRWSRAVKATSQWMSSIVDHASASHSGEDGYLIAVATIFSVLARYDIASNAFASSFPEGISYFPVVRHGTLDTVGNMHLTMIYS